MKFAKNKTKPPPPQNTWNSKFLDWNREHQCMIPDSNFMAELKRNKAKSSKMGVSGGSPVTVHVKIWNSLRSRKGTVISFWVCQWKRPLMPPSLALYYTGPLSSVNLTLLSRPSLSLPHPSPFPLHTSLPPSLTLIDTCLEKAQRCLIIKYKSVLDWLSVDSDSNFWIIWNLLLYFLTYGGSYSWILYLFLKKQ